MSIFKFLSKFQHFLKKFWDARTFWLRVLLCWAIGCAFLFTDYSSNFDLRFKIRGNVNTMKDIVLLTVDESDWRKMRNVQVDTFESLNSLYLNETLTDNYYWDEALWSKILKKTLELQPKKIGVTFFFGSNLGKVSISPQSQKLFKNKKIVWPSRISPEGQIQFPLFSLHQNTGIIDIHPDVDGMVRSYEVSHFELPHFAFILSDQKRPIESYRKNYVINYQTYPQKMQIYRAIDLFTGKITEDLLRNKTVIIGARDSREHLYPTPMGFMTKSELIAQIVDNFNHERFPRKLPIEFYAVYLLFLLAISLTLILQYPQGYALALIVCFGAIASGVSAWAFDTFFIWTPILSAIIQMIATYIIFISYKLAKNERRTWHLEQEKSYLFELEQLKNNFISLISHDLKTPIAKIQGIADRMIQNSNDEKVTKDLEIVKNSSQDLYRYIQSILQITRVESSDFKIKKEATDINEIIEKTVSELMPLAYEKSMTIKTTLEPMFSIEIDTALIHEVIANLIENAIKYTPNGGLVEVLSIEKNDQVYISVRDNGGGIPFEEQTQIWEKFYRGKKFNLSTRGTGLGLYLVKYFIELHGGKVFLKSSTEEPTGTEIGFILPVEDERSK